MIAKWRHWTTTVGLVVAAMLLLSACGAAPAGDADSAGLAAPAAANEPQAADFPIIVYNGGGLLAGPETSFGEVLTLGRPVVLNMWAGLCPPCRLEMPDFEKVSGEFGDRVLILGLDVGPFTNLGSSQDGQSLIRELGITYPTGTTTDLAPLRDYQVLGMPTTYFITADGQILRRWTGLLTADQLSELVQALIDSAAGS
jgi:thiol-disulfide isomerase/thioredoxin